MERLPFITFEGSEGCGKTTQVQLLANRLDAGGIPFLITREPGGTAIGETIRELLQYAPQSTGMTPETEVLLFEASRAQLVREIIKPALDRGEGVRWLSLAKRRSGFCAAHTSKSVWGTHI